MEIDAIMAAGDLGLAACGARGSNSDRLNGFLPPSRKHFNYSQSHWFRITGGKHDTC
jgi:hypothetical protein